MVISFYNIKGGVGKTSTSINIASIAKKRGKILLFDLDIQGASSYFFNKNPKKRDILSKPIEKIIKNTEFENLDIIPADTNLEKYKNSISILIEELKKIYDFIIIDAPATLNPLTKDILKHSSIILVPVLPNILSLRTYNQIINTNLNNNIKLFVNQFENKPSHKKIIKHILTLPTPQYLKTYIPKSELIESMSFHKFLLLYFLDTFLLHLIYKKALIQLIHFLVYKYLNIVILAKLKYVELFFCEMVCFRIDL